MEEEQALDWKGTKRTRLCNQDVSKTNPVIGTPTKEANALETLIQHYPHIVYLCYSLWRKMLIFVYPVENKIEEEDLFFLSPVVSNLKLAEHLPELSVQQFGVAGNLQQFSKHYLDDIFLTERRPLNNQNLASLDVDQTWPADPHSQAAVLPPFLKRLYINDHVDVLSIMISSLQLSLTDQWVFDEGQRKKGTVLHNACRVVPSLRIPRLLVKLGVSVNARQPGTDILVLHSAVANGSAEVVRFLVQCGAGVNSIALDCPPLAAAVASSGKTNNREVMQTLIDLGADVNATVESGSAHWTRKRTTALHFAVVLGHYEEARLLLTNGANTEAALADGTTPFLNAASEGKVELCALLLEHGANIHATEGIGHTALHRAVLNDHLEVVKFLLAQSDLDINAVCSSGKTALALAQSTRLQSRFQSDAQYSELEKTREAIARLIFDHGGKSRSDKEPTGTTN